MPVADTAESTLVICPVAPDVAEQLASTATVPWGFAAGAMWVVACAYAGVDEESFDRNETRLKRAQKVEAQARFQRQRSPPQRWASLRLIRVSSAMSDRVGLLGRRRREDLAPAGLGFRFGFRSLLDFFATFIFVSHGRQCATFCAHRKSPGNANSYEVSASVVSCRLPKREPSSLRRRAWAAAGGRD